MYYTQGNVIFHFIHAIFDERLFSKYTNSYAKEYKLYNKLLDKTSLKTELSLPILSGKNGSALISISYTPIPSTPNNPPTYSPSLFLSYRSISSLPTPGFKSL